MSASWDSLTPQEQAQVWERYNAGRSVAPEVASVKAAQPALVYMAMVCAVLTWLLLPVLLGVVAIVSAIVGDIQVHKATGRNSKLAVAALLIAGVGIVVAQLA